VPGLAHREKCRAYEPRVREAIRRDRELRDSDLEQDPIQVK